MYDVGDHKRTRQEVDKDNEEAHAKREECFLHREDRNIGAILVVFANAMIDGACENEEETILVHGGNRGSG